MIKFILGLVDKPTQWFLGMLLSLREKFFVASKVNGVDDNNVLESKQSEEETVSDDQLYYDAEIQQLKKDISNPLNGNVNRQTLTAMQGGIHYSSGISSQKKTEMFSEIAEIDAVLLQTPLSVLKDNLVTSPVKSGSVDVAVTEEAETPSSVITPVLLPKIASPESTTTKEVETPSSVITPVLLPKVASPESTTPSEVETPSSVKTEVISPKPASPEKSTTDKKEKYAKNLEKISGFLKILSDKADELNKRDEKAAYGVMRLILDDLNTYGNEYLIDGKVTKYKTKVELLMKNAENNLILNTHRESFGLKNILNTLASMIATILTFGAYRGTLFGTDSRNQVISANKRFANDLAVTPFDSDEQEEPTETSVASM